MLEYEKIPLHWVNRLGFLVRKELSSRFNAAGYQVSPEEWAILLVLWKHGAQSPGVLADVTIKDKTTMTRLIDAMVRKNLVSRAEDADNRRRSVVAVTDDGMAVQGDLIGIAQDVIKRALANIPSGDIETTTRTLQAMTENLLSAPQDDHAQRSHQNDKL